MFQEVCVGTGKLGSLSISVILTFIPQPNVIFFLILILLWLSLVVFFFFLSIMLLVKLSALPKKKLSINDVFQCETAGFLWITSTGSCGFTRREKSMLYRVCMRFDVSALASTPPPVVVGRST